MPCKAKGREEVLGCCFEAACVRLCQNVGLFGFLNVLVYTQVVISVLLDARMNMCVCLNALSSYVCAIPPEPLRLSASVRDADSLMASPAHHKPHSTSY